MGRKIEDIVKECIGKALREDFQDDVSLNDPLRHLRNYDKVTDGDSARLEPQEPTEPPLPPTPNPWPKPKNNDEKRDIRKRQMQHSCANTIRNLEALGQPYDLEQVAKDISQRYNYDLNQVLDFLRLVYKQQEGILAINEAQLKKIVAESVKRVLNEISQGLVDRARDAAFNDMKNNWNNPKIRTKREGQWKKFSNAAIDMEREEKNSVCPEVPASKLYNMPPETYVVMDGAGRDGYSNFVYRYSGHAGTKEQCEEFVNRFYDKGADWEFMPEIFSLEEYIRYKKQHPYC